MQAALAEDIWPAGLRTGDERFQGETAMDVRSIVLGQIEPGDWPRSASTTPAGHD
ncbi:hypothetical protein [Azotobacter chroococcum]|jgi:hypothetical protein|uniref:hypothetical protein n=1 Tax=Azotobacter chroococcum TaxID=353 RepID=UPI0013F144A1|nr:hypothetical protein [Azotobacter chroococcum]